MVFNNLLGNEHIKKRLDEFHLSHSYIITGPLGSGRHTLAVNIAAAYLCESRDSRPCMHCKHCRKTFSKIHPDISYINILDKKKSISVEQIRDLRTNAYIMPNDANGKVFIIENADTMDSAPQNALLKILEEPPSGVCIILIGKHPGDFLPTVRSRCIELTLEILSDNLIYDYLKKHFPTQSDDKIKSAVSISEGCIGKAITQLDDISNDANDLVNMLLKTVNTLDEVDIVLFSQEIEKRGQSLDDFFVLAKSTMVKALETSFNSSSLDKGKFLATILMLEKINNYQKFNVGSGHLSGAFLVELLSLKKQLGE